MSAIAESQSVIEKTRELCESIVEDSNFKKLQGDVETFLNDESAKLQYQSVHQRGQELQNKQQSGVELSKQEIKEFEEAREELLGNDLVRNFLEAKTELENLQRVIVQHVGMTMEMGRVPSPEEVAHETGGGCCGGGGEGCCG
ncbi:MAG: YlbF family regulator [Akkermansiaceae bacterium]|nr:YlbF family regulator [Akkermansiaceae bacterium]